MIATLVVLAFWAVAGVLRLLELTLTYASSLLERSIARYHSVVFAFVDAVWGNVLAAWYSSTPPTSHPMPSYTSAPSWQHHHAQQSTHRPPKVHDAWQQRKTSSRAYWDPSKGSAIVIWSTGDQTFSHSIALALAAQHARKRPTRAGQPPYTVIVIVPSSSDSLTDLIGAWAQTKAEATKHIDSQQRDRRDGSETSSASGSSGERTPRPDSDIARAKHRREDTTASSSTNKPVKPTKRRKLSFGGWSTSGVVGYGVGMLKGLHVGQEDVTRGIGAVIPIVADTSTSAGIAYAQSTIQDYCISHDLLLRGLIVVPSIMTMSDHAGSSTAPTTSDTASASPKAVRSRIPTPPKTPTADSQALVRMAGDTALALESDVKEALLVIAALHPSLQTDGGRVIGLVPSAWRSEGAYTTLISAAKELESQWSTSQGPLLRVKTSRKEAASAKSDYDVVRTATMQMWDQIERALRITGGNVTVSRVSMAPLPATRIGTRASAMSRRAARGKESVWRTILAHFAAIAHPLLYPVQPSPFAKAMSDLRAAAAGAGADEDIDGGSQDDCNEPSEDEGDGADGDYRVAAQGLGARASAPSESSIPPLLTQAIRSLLARSVPRKHASIGLGPRLEHLCTYMPGHRTAQQWLAAALA